MNTLARPTWTLSLALFGITVQIRRPSPRPELTGDALQRVAERRALERDLQRERDMAHVLWMRRS